MNAGGRPSCLVDQPPGLDFLNALGGSGRISDCESLLRWLEQNKLVASDAIASVRAAATSEELTAVSVEAKALGAWFRDFVDDFRGNPLSPSAVDRLQPLNGILAREARVRQIDIRDNLSDRIAGSGLKWSTGRIWRTADMLLLPIAHAMAELICSVDFSSIRVCEGPGCEMFSLVRTRERTRRSCRAAVCRRS